MKQILKQVAGVDIAQKELVISIGRMFNDLTIDIYAYKVFKNTATGMKAALKWVKSMTSEERSVLYVMEATGIYHEKFAYYLSENQYDISIILPNKISNYFRTLEIKTITDKTSSQTIAQFGLERKLDLWQPPLPVFKNLKQLTREQGQIVEERTRVKNQLHSEVLEAVPNSRSIKRLKARIKFLNSQEQEIKNDIQDIINSDHELKNEIDKITTIPGIGQLTVVIALAETNGFELIRNKKQLTSYAGFDVKEKQSGTSVKGKARISKRGNKYLRSAMHLPSLSAVKYNQNHKDLYSRIVSRTGIKKKGLIAVQRKLLELIYVLYKNKTFFLSNYENEKRADNLLQTAALL